MERSEKKKNYVKPGIKIFQMPKDCVLMESSHILRGSDVQDPTFEDITGKAGASVWDGEL